jgi:hypothetical protein
MTLLIIQTIYHQNNWTMANNEFEWMWKELILILGTIKAVAWSN